MRTWRKEAAEEGAAGGGPERVQWRPRGGRLPRRLRAWGGETPKISQVGRGAADTQEIARVGRPADGREGWWDSFPSDVGRGHKPLLPPGHSVPSLLA